MEQELREYLDSRFEDIRQGFDQTNQRLDQVDTRLGQLEDQGRQTHVVVEDLRGQIAIVAEGVVGLRERHDRFREEVRSELGEVRQLFGVAYTHLDRRLKSLEPT